MASKDPSPEDIANLEKEQREAELQAELQAEFDEFERQEQERARKQAEYDRERSRIEMEYQKADEGSGKKSYTGFRVIDEYLDASDTKKSKAAAAKWEKEYKDIETREKAGKISPDYASFLKTQAAEKLQAGKKSKARYMIEEVQRTGSGLIKAGDSYLSNTPSRGGGRRKPSLKSGGRSRKAAPRQNGFSSGIGMGVAFPQMMVAPPQPRQGNGGQRKPQPSMGSIGFPSFTVSTPKPKGGGKMSGPKFPTMSFSTAPKFGKSLLKPRDPFGAKKTSPLKKGKKRLWD